VNGYGLPSSIPERKMIRRIGSALVMLVPTVTGGGCRTPDSTLRVTELVERGGARTYQETFPESYYSLDPWGNLDLVLLRNRPSGTDQRLRSEQIVHVRGVWRSIPGVTNVNETQINGVVVYAVLQTGQESSYEGAGFLFFRKKAMEEVILGSFHRVRIRPARGQGEAPPLWGPAELSGRFRAVRDDARVARTINDLTRRLLPET
jgi:hypothetical protein